MRTGPNGSKRKLTKTHLVVDWEGHNNLFYRMTKREVRRVMESARIARTTEKLYCSPKVSKSFGVVSHLDGSVEIGCEHFTLDEVRELVKWSGAKVGRSRKRAPKKSRGKA